MMKLTSIFLPMPIDLSTALWERRYLFEDGDSLFGFIMGDVKLSLGNEEVSDFLVSLVLSGFLDFLVDFEAFFFQT